MTLPTIKEKRKPGRPRKQPDAPAQLPAPPYLDANGNPLPSGLALITVLATQGAPQRKIAAELGILFKTFKRLLDRSDDVVRLAWEAGKAEVENRIVQNLLKASDAGHVVASIFYAKAQMQWQEQAAPDNRPNVIIQIPDALSPEQYIRVINEPVRRKVNRHDVQQLPAPERAEGDQ
jgi:hypothetical protein